MSRRSFLVSSFASFALVVACSPFAGTDGENASTPGPGNAPTSQSPGASAPDASSDAPSEASTTPRDGGGSCITNTTDFSSGDLAANGFGAVVGSVELGKVAGAMSSERALVAKVQLPGSSSGEAHAGGAYALPDGERFDSMVLSFDVFTSAMTGTTDAIVGCMISTRASEDETGTNNQFRFNVRGTAAFASHERRINGVDDTPDVRSFDNVAVTSSVWHHVEIAVNKTDDAYSMNATFDSTSVNLQSLPASVGDPRFVAVRCGISHAQNDAAVGVNLEVAVDNVSAQLCTLPTP